MGNGDPGQANGADDKHSTKPSTAPAPKGIPPEQQKPAILNAGSGVVVDQTEEARIKGKEAQNAAQPSQKDILDRIKAGERWMIIFTAIVALTTVAQFIQSGCNNRSTSKQVDKIIGAANTQACAARSFAASASKINTGIGDAVGKLNLQADKLEANVIQAARLAKATEKANANVVNADRPWMGAVFNVDGFASGKTPTYSVIFVNSGKRPARVTLTQTLSIPLDYGANPIYGSYDTTPSVSVIVPGQPLGSAWKDTDPTRNPITDELMKRFDAGTVPFRVYAKIEYTDIRTNTPYWTHACWRYTPKQTATTNGFSNCTEYNDAK